MSTLDPRDNKNGVVEQLPTKAHNHDSLPNLQVNSPPRDSPTEAHNHEPLSNTQGNTFSNISPDVSNYLNVPISLRKAKRSCTMHLVSNFVSYEKLSPNTKSFLFSLWNNSS